MNCWCGTGLAGTRPEPGLICRTGTGTGTGTWVNCLEELNPGFHFCVELGPKQSIVFKELKPEVLHKIQPNNFILFYFIYCWNFTNKWNYKLETWKRSKFFFWEVLSRLKVREKNKCKKIARFVYLVFIV